MTRHIRFLIVILACFGLINNTLAQTASQYSFTPLSSTFTPLTSGTTVSAVHVDDGVSGLLPLGFTFTYCGNAYSQVVVSSNGWLSFTSKSGSGLSNSTSSFPDINPGLMWLWDDASGTAGTCKYLTTGTAPNRVFTVEFLNWRWNYSSSNNPVVSVQVKLYETTGVIEYIYRRENNATASNSGSASIGIVDANATPTYLSLNNVSAAPTASSTVFTTNLSALPATGQLYRFAPVFCDANTVYPTALTTTSSTTTGCSGYYTNIGITTNTPMPNVAGTTYRLQFATSASGPWTTIGTYSSSNNSVQVFQPGFYRYELLCSNTLLGIASTPVQVMLPSLAAPVVRDTFICGGQNLTLNSTTNTGLTTRWYENINDRNPVHVGNAFNTLVQSTQTFYVAAADSGGNLNERQVGNGTLTPSTTNPSPINQFYSASNTQILYLGSELTTAGLSAGNIESISFNIVGLPSITQHQGYTIKMTQVPAAQTTLATMLPSASMTQVYTGNENFNTLGWRKFTFATPFQWDGNSNIVIEFCYTPVATWSSTGLVQSFAANNRVRAYRTDSGPACNQTGSNTASEVPNMRFEINSVCETQRIPVTVNVTSAADVTVAATTTACIGNLVPLQITSPLQNYDEYIWANNTPNSIFLDSLGLVPYNGTSATKVWVTASNIANAATYLFSSNSINSCSAIDTININFVDERPILNLGGDIDSCVNNGTLLFLDAQNPGSEYIWDNNHNARVRTIDRSGTYWVKVTNSIGCYSTDTINVVLKPNPISTLMEDTTVCIGQQITLNAGNDGIRYYWNTGATTNSIDVDQSGEYIVFITARNGCILTDTMQVYQNGQLPTSDGIQIRNAGIRTFDFSIRNPQFVIGYEWDFGDGSPTVFQQSPSHTYTQNGNFLVRCYVSSSCGFVMDTLSVHIFSTGVRELGNDVSIKVYPNPAQDHLNIAFEDLTLALEHVKIVAADGRTLIDQAFKHNDPKSINVKSLASGLYQIMIQTNKGVRFEKFIKE